MPHVTVIVATCDRASFVQSTVRQLLAQSFQNCEFFIVDQSEPDNAESNQRFVQTISDSRLYYIHVAKRGLPNARNVGLSRARGQVVVFTDDDVILLSDDFIEAHVRCYDDSAIGGVVGRHIERELKENSLRTACHVDWSGRTIFNLRGKKRQVIGSCKGSNMSFRMAAVAQIGGFDRRTNLLEDTDFSVRIAQAGWSLLYEPAAEVVHLSAGFGGVRKASRIATEARRFYSTAYFVGKHRGVLGMACFLFMFSVIALTRAVHFRSLKVLPVLARALKAGFAESRLPPDQDIHCSIRLEPDYRL